MPFRAQALQEMRSLHTLIRSTRTFIYLQYRVLLENQFSNLNELQIPHRWRNGYHARLKCSRWWVRAPVGHTKDFKIDMCCFSAKHTALRRKSTDWLARNQNNVSEWSDMSTRGLLFQ